MTRHISCPACGHHSPIKNYEIAPHRIDVIEQGKSLGRAKGWIWRKGLAPSVKEKLIVKRAARRAGGLERW